MQLGVLLLLWSSCSSGNPEQELHLSLRQEPQTLHPMQATNSSSQTLAYMFFEGLVRSSESGQAPQLAAAKKYLVSEDGKIYTFHLKKTHWTNGDVVSAKDFEYAWKKLLNPSTKSSLAYQLFPIKNAKEAKEGLLSLNEVGVNAIDDFTLKIELEYALPYFVELLAGAAFFPVNQKLELRNPHWAESFSRDFVGNGPFALNEWEKGKKIEAIKNPRYLEQKSVFLKKIDFTFFADEQKELDQYENGKLDWVGAPTSSLPADYFDQLKDRKDFSRYPISAAYWYLFNTEAFPFTHEKLRQAFSYGLNRTQLLENLTDSAHIPATGIVPPTDKRSHKKSLFIDGNIQLAKKLFAEALSELGIKKENFPLIKITINDAPGHKDMAQAVKKQWEQLFDIKVEIENLEWKSYLMKLSKGEFQVGRFGWIANFDDPMSFLELFRYKVSLNNHTNWEDQEYIGLLDQASLEMDLDKRELLLSQAEDQLIKSMPLIPLYYYTNAYLKKTELQGVYVSPVGYLDFKRARKV